MDHQQKDETAVAYLATAMNTKLARARAKGRSGWDTPECTQQHLSNLLREHVEKGDPVDVANFCAFLAARGEGIAPRQCLAQIEEPAGAAPAAVAPHSEYPPLPEGVMFIEQIGGDVIARPTEYAYFKNARGVVHGAQLFTADQLRANFDLGRQAAPALEAPAAPAVEALRALMSLVRREAPHLSGKVMGEADAILAGAALAAAPQAPAAPDPRTPADMLVNGGALKLALNVLRRAGKNEVADELEKTAASAAPAVDAQAERDAAFEAVRNRLCSLQRYSFVLDDDGIVRRAQDRTGSWIEFDDAHALCDPVAVDAAIAAQAAAKGDA